MYLTEYWNDDDDDDEEIEIHPNEQLKIVNDFEQEKNPGENTPERNREIN